MWIDQPTKTCTACLTEQPRDRDHFKMNIRIDGGFHHRCIRCIADRRPVSPDIEAVQRAVSNQRYWNAARSDINERRRIARGFQKMNAERRAVRQAEAAKSYRQRTVVEMLLDPLRARHAAVVPPAVWTLRTEAEWLGCGLGELVTRFEDLFVEGMSWRNRREWQIDHILPLKAFALSDPRQVAVAAHHLNLRPIWSRQNSSKGGRLPPDISAAVNSWRRDPDQPFPSEVRAWQAAPIF